jgi:hypothetical protein
VESELSSPLGDDRFAHFRYVMSSVQDFVRLMKSVYLAMDHQATVKGPNGTTTPLMQTPVLLAAEQKQ